MKQPETVMNNNTEQSSATYPSHQPLPHRGRGGGASRNVVMPLVGIRGRGIRPTATSPIGIRGGAITHTVPSHMGIRGGTITHTILIPILLIILTLFSSPLTTSAHSLATSGRIYGQLQDGTKRKAPVVGQSVTLQMAQGGNARDLMTVTTDARGMFSFNALATDKTISYAVYTLYQKAQYVTDLIDLSSKPVQPLNLVVYDATNSTDNIAIVQANVLIDKADAQHGLLTITESFFFENLGATTYVGSLQANGQKPNALRFSLPPGARQLSLKTGFDGYQVIQVDPGFASDAAILPGTSQFAFSFQVPYSSSNYDFRYTVVYPTVVLAVLVPLDYHASSSGLTSQGAVNANQQTYQQLSAKQVLAGAEIHVQLAGLPSPTTAASSTSVGQNIPWFILVLILMVAIVFATWFTYMRMQRKAVRRKQTVKKGTSQKQSARRTIEPAPQKVAQEQQEELLQELLALDKAYEAGTIKKADYQERRAKMKARLRTIINAEAVEQTTTKKKAARSGGKARS